MERCYFIFIKPYAHSRETIPINKTYSLCENHVHHKINNAKSSQVNMHIIQLDTYSKKLYSHVTIASSMNKSSVQQNQRKIVTHEPKLSQQCIYQAKPHILNQVNSTRTMTNMQLHISYHIRIGIIIF